MKAFELAYLGVSGFLPPLPRMIRGRLRGIARSFEQPPLILDVGGRKSHYTIGVRGRITLSDLPRETAVQHDLNLGLNEGMIGQTLGRRSNVERIVYDDMTQSAFGDQSFDCVVAVEVLEHVAEDDRFVSEVHRVLKPGGYFLMSTPNGDSVENTNPDHKRHYRREQLRALLAAHFASVEVIYAIPGGWSRTVGLKSWSARHPVRTLLSMFGNVVNGIQATAPGLREQAEGTRHLVAMARRGLAEAAVGSQVELGQREQVARR